MSTATHFFFTMMRYKIRVLLDLRSVLLGYLCHALVWLLSTSMPYSYSSSSA